MNNSIDPEEKIKRFDEAYALIQQQAEDWGLWFIPKHITEDYIQKALRKLSAVIEGDRGILNILEE